MDQIKKMLSLFAVTILLAACGGGGGTTTATQITGQVQQGNIAGATVFLDLNGNGVKESGEPAADNPTAADGKFSLNLTAEQVTALKAATATAKIVSEGGTDTTTGLAAGLLVSDPPPVTGDSAAKNITPMSTLMALTPDSQKGKLKTVLGTLGLKDTSGSANDDALINTSTPAVIAICKSVEAALLNIQQATSGKGKDVSVAVTKAAAVEMGKALSEKTKTELTDTAKLADILSAAAGTAISGKKTQLGVTDAQVTSMVTSIGKGCKDVADAVKSKTGGSLSTEDHSKTEAEIMHEAGDQIRHSVDSTSAEVETETHAASGGASSTK